MLEFHAQPGDGIDPQPFIDESLTQPRSGLDFNDLLKLLASYASLEGRHFVFDLDNTTLRGDIGEAVFGILGESGRLAAIPIEPLDPVSGNSANPTEIPKRRDDEGYLEFYGRALDFARSQPDEDAVIASIYLWMTAAQAGLEKGVVENATAQAWEGFLSAVRTGDDLGHRPGLSPRREILELMKLVLDRDGEIWIVSATNQISVSWTIENVINSELKKLGAKSIIKPEQVRGVRSAEMPISSAQLMFPAPAYGGKAALINSLIQTDPFLVAGDSPNDLPMMANAEVRLWVGRPDKPGAQTRFERCFATDTSVRDLLPNGNARRSVNVILVSATR